MAKGKKLQKRIEQLIGEPDPDVELVRAAARLGIQNGTARLAMNITSVGEQHDAARGARVLEYLKVLATTKDPEERVIILALIKSSEAWGNQEKKIAQDVADKLKESSTSFTMF
jgi:hypothetical protein